MEPCPKCHRDTSHLRWSMNGSEYSECGRCGTAVAVTNEGVNQ